MEKRKYQRLCQASDIQPGKEHIHYSTYRISYVSPYRGKRKQQPKVSYREGHQEKLAKKICRSLGKTVVRTVRRTDEVHLDLRPVVPGVQGIVKGKRVDR